MPASSSSAMVASASAPGRSNGGRQRMLGRVVGCTEVRSGGKPLLAEMKRVSEAAGAVDRDAQGIDSAKTVHWRCTVAGGRTKKATS